MANTIRLKRASGSDPGASDLVTGELAVRTDTGKLFTKKDDNSIAEIGAVSNAATATKLETARTIAGVSFDGSANISLNNNAITNGAGYITATLTNEQVQDIVGGMLTGNTETGITVTYQDGDGTIDFVVGTLNQDTTGNAATATALETARTIAGVSFDGTGNISLNNNAITNGAGYLTSVATSNIADDAVTYAKIQNVTQDRILGRQSSGTGIVQELNAANIRSMINVEDGATNVTNNNQLTNGAGYITATLTNEQVQDIVGAMVTGNTESGITVTYQDSDGTLDFSVASQTGSLNASNLSSGTIPDARFPSTLPAVDGSNLTGISAGATGGGSDEVFYENDQTVTTNYTITNGKNAMAAGPITINSGVTVTVGSGETLTIV